MYKEIINNFSINNNYIKIQEPATETQIIELIYTFGEIPSTLYEFLKEMNGDGFLMMSTSQIIEINSLLRTMDDFMPLDCLLFFAMNGCGDYYGFQIRKTGINQDNIFKWDHEYDNRIWIASCVKDLIINYYNGECV
jgi:hypothetical protein